MTRKPSGLKEMLPLSPLQQGMLFHALLDTNGPDIYTVQWGISLEGPLDSVAMRAAGQALLDRHANLRAGYRYVKSGSAVAVIPHWVELPWNELDLSGLCPAERATELPCYLTEERERRFDLANPPLMRFTLIRLGPEHYHLVITYHHILLDGWSIPLVREELFALYARRNETNGLTPVTPYRDYLAWLTTQDRPAAETAWHQALAGLEEPTLVASADDRHRLPLAPDWVTNRLPERLTTTLTRQARQCGVTLNTVVQAAWAILLSRLTGRDDVVYGVTVSGRPAELAGVETTIGLFINTVPARVQLQPWEPVAQVLTQLQTDQTGLLAHHHLGLADIQRLAGVSPLFDTLVVYENFPADPCRLVAPVSELRITNEELYTVTHYPLTVVAYPGPSLTVELSYRPDLFDRDTVEAMAGRLVRILESIAAKPDQPLGRIDILTAQERHQLLVEWNDTAHAMPQATLPELFEAQAARTPNATALVLGNTEIPYGQLNSEANRLARVLIDQGAGPERMVALALPRSTETIVAMLAVLKTGSAYLPLDPDYPAERIAFMIEDADPVLIVTTTALASALPDHCVPRHLILDDPRIRAAWAESDGTDLTDTERAGPLRIGTAAYVLHTSGSTGQPKGVVVSHEGVASLMATAVDRLGVGPDSRMLHFASISFDASVWQLCIALLAGGRLMIVPDERRVAGPALTDYIREHAVTHMGLPPSLVAMLPEDCALPAGATLLVGTERVPPQLVTRWSTTLRLFAAYGLTEATVNSTLWRASPEWTGQSVPIGRPDPGTQVYVLDTTLHPVPIGVTGELYVTGDGLARGYLGQPGLTAERFVADPYGPPGKRMYRTGDLVRWQPNGILDFLGRNDNQIKIRGYRIEPGEIETALAQHPDVAQTAVVAREDQPGQRRLVGYVVPLTDHAVDPVELRSWVAKALPEYMVPTAVVTLEAMPLTPSGKLDRDALPAPNFTGRVSSREPTNAREQILCDLFVEILGLPQVGIDDSFFALGGDSIMSIQLTSRARRAGVVISPREVFQRKTVAELAAVTRETADVMIEAPETALGLVPLTPIMRWLCGLNGSIDRYAQAMTVQTPIGLGQERLSRLVDALLDRHDLLRARLERPDGDGREWALRVGPKGSMAASTCILRVDTAGLDDEGLQQTIETEAAAAQARLAPHDGIVVQVVWFNCGSARSGRLLMMIHHLVVDGVSWRILLEDLAAGWAQVTASQPVVLPACGTSFRRWAQLLAEQARDPARVGELEMWKEVLDDGDPLLGDRPLDPVRDTVGTCREVTLTLPAPQAEPLLASVPAAFHAGVDDVLLCGLALSVAQWRHQRGHDDQRSVMVNLEGHGRQEQIVEGVDLSRTVGWFTTIFPVRLDVSGLDLDDALTGGPAAGQALKRVKEHLRTIPDHGLGFGLLRHLNPETRAVLAGLPAPQITFNYLGRFAVSDAVDWGMVPGSGLGGGTVVDLPVSHSLEINAWTEDRSDGPHLSASWSWPARLLAEDAVRELANGWFQALDAMTAHAAGQHAGGHTPSDFPLVTLSQAEIDGLDTAQPDLVDVLPLSPLQEGLLCHSSLDGHGSDVYTIQLIFDLEGELDVATLQAAGQALLDRYPNLRATVGHTIEGQSVAVIPRQARLPWQVIDLSSLDPAVRPAEATRLLTEDRACGFDLTQPPLMRALLVRLGIGHHRVGITVHHMLLDGWSAPILIRELLALYVNRGDLTALAPAPQYRDYLAWLATQDRPAAEAAWHQALTGLNEPTLIAGADRQRLPLVPDKVIVDLSEELTATLAHQARQLGVTLNTVVQAAWGLLLSRLTDRADVVFAVTVSGRPAELAGVEAMVGSLMNNVLARVRFRPGEPVAQLLTRLQAEQAELLTHHHLGLVDIQRLTGLGQLFDTLLAYENFPSDSSSLDEAVPRLRVTDEEHWASHYPLMLMAAPGPRLTLVLAYRPELYDRTAAEAITARLARILEAVAADPGQTIDRVGWR